LPVVADVFKYMFISDLAFELPGAVRGSGSRGVSGWMGFVVVQIAGRMPVTVMKHGQVNKPLFSL
jgi:hypothetical protein